MHDVGRSSADLHLIFSSNFDIAAFNGCLISGKTRLLLEEVLVRPAGGAHPVVCVGPNAPV